MDATTGETFRVGIIGTGRSHGSEGATGYGMAAAHAKGYNATGRCRIVGLCDLVPERADTFNDEHTGGKAAIFTDYREMIAETHPDIVSICTWPDLHAPLTIGSAEMGIVRAIHCEKPVAATWEDAKRMAASCEENDVQLTFNHQRRFLDTFLSARRLVAEGAIGKLARMEATCNDMFDWGTHWLNMMLFYNEESPAAWVMGQVDARRPKTIFGVPMETQGVAVIGFQNGATGVLHTGEHARDFVGCVHRLIGDNGTIEIHDSAPHLRIRTGGDSDFRAAAAVIDGLHGNIALDRAIADVVDSLAEGRRSLLDVSNALATTEIIFAVYESARRRGRIDLPLDITGNPFRDMLAEGVFPNAVAATP